MFHIHYSRETCLVLAGMIVTGALRIVSVKLYYQFNVLTSNPLLLTLLYLLGQTLSLVVHAVQQQQQQGQEETQGDLTAKSSVTIIKPGFSKLPTNDQDAAAELAQGESSSGLFQTVSSDSFDNDDNNDDNNAIMDIPQDKECGGTLELTQLHHREATSSAHHCLGHDDCNIVVPINSINPAAVSHMINDSIDTTASLSQHHHHHHHGRPLPRRQGSQTGLTAASHTAVAWWVHALPWHVKPVVPAVFNVCNATLRLASLIYMAASTAEVLIGGTELVLSVVAARVIRQRQVSHHRWMGVAIVTAALLAVGLADIYAASRMDHDASSSSSSSSSNGTTVDIKEPLEQSTHAILDEPISTTSFDPLLPGEASTTTTTLTVTTATASAEQGQWIGILLIIGQCITSVLQDITEEIFMAESDFPPTLLLGMEGFIGLAVALVGFFPLADALGLDNPWHALHSISWTDTAYCLYITAIFTATGIFNITATAVTSSMTRNVWKNVRTLLVWALGLLLHVMIVANVGEAWSMPSSLVVPAASVVMWVGIRFYYMDT